MTVLTWLHLQAEQLFATFGAIIANRPEPARQVAEELAYTVAALAVVWVVIKIAKKLK